MMIEARLILSFRRKFQFFFPMMKARGFGPHLASLYSSWPDLSEVFFKSFFIRIIILLSAR